MNDIAGETIDVVLMQISDAIQLILYVSSAFE